jgi:hypothetical protein
MLMPQCDRWMTFERQSCHIFVTEFSCAAWNIGRALQMGSHPTIRGKT